MIAADEEHFFDIGKGVFKKISIRNDAVSKNIQSTIYDDLGVIRSADNYIITKEDVVNIILYDHGIEIKRRDGKSVFI